MLKKMLQFKTVVEVPLQRILDILCSVFEDGYNSWILVKAADIADEADKLNGEFDGIKQIILGGNVTVYDLEEPNTKLGILNLVNIVKALQSMAYGEDLKGNKNEVLKTHFDNFVNENDDAETADVIAQIAVMGEVVFG
jgi:hypothetical protein